MGFLWLVSGRTASQPLAGLLLISDAMKQDCSIENAPKFADWIANRGGIAVWRSVNLSNPGASWSTPANQLDGTSTLKPTWQAGDKPHAIITSTDDVTVYVDKEIKRFRVAIRGTGPYGATFKCTDAASRKIKKAVADAGDEAYHTFDYETQEAVVMVEAKELEKAQRFDDAVTRARALISPQQGQAE